MKYLLKLYFQGQIYRAKKPIGDIYEYPYVPQFPLEKMIDTLVKVLSLTAYQIVPLNQLYDKDTSLTTASEPVIFCYRDKKIF